MKDFQIFSMHFHHVAMTPSLGKGRGPFNKIELPFTKGNNKTCLVEIDPVVFDKKIFIIKIRIIRLELLSPSCYNLPL